MQALLAKLNKTQGIRGSMIVNKDGIVVASDLSMDLDEDGVGAVASSILAALNHTIYRVKLGNLSRFTITGSENKIIMLNTGSVLFLVLVDREANMGLINLELKETAAQIEQNTHM